MLTQNDKETLWKLIKPIGTAMMASWNGEFAHARPMHHVNDTFDGTLLYYTNVTSGKIDEISENPEVCVTYADPDSSTYVSLSGIADFTQDRALIEKYWSPFVAAWFPNGKDDPNIRIMKVHIYLAEYWDSPSSKMVQLFQIAKANLLDTTPDMGKHRKLG